MALSWRTGLGFISASFWKRFEHPLLRRLLWQKGRNQAQWHFFDPYPTKQKKTNDPEGLDCSPPGSRWRTGRPPPWPGVPGPPGTARAVPSGPPLRCPRSRGLPRLACPGRCRPPRAPPGLLSRLSHSRPDSCIGSQTQFDHGGRVGVNF